MMGLWAGTAHVYNEQGVYEPEASSSSIARIAWKEGSTTEFLFTQVELNADTAAQAIKDEQDATKKTLRQHVSTLLGQSIKFHVDGKGATGESDTFNVIGTETMPGIYLFQLAFKPGLGQDGGVYYNNQYFLDSSQRNIIGPYVDGERKTQHVIAQTFARISYDPGKLNALPGVT